MAGIRTILWVVLLTLLLAASSSCVTSDTTRTGCDKSMDTAGSRVGLSSYIPFGKGGSAFRRSWGDVLATNAGKSVPVAGDLTGDGR